MTGHIHTWAKAGADCVARCTLCGRTKMEHGPWRETGPCNAVCETCGAKRREHDYREMKLEMGTFHVGGKKYHYSVVRKLKCERCAHEKENWLTQNRPITELTLILFDHLVHTYGADIDFLARLVNRSPEQTATIIRAVKENRGRLIWGGADDETV